MESLLAGLASLDAAMVAGLLGVLVLLESAAFLGLAVPGEVALVTAGAASAVGALPLAVVVAVGVVAAVAGQAAGYELGRRYGAALLERAGSRPRLARHVPRVRRLLDRQGIWLLVVGRWAGPLRALAPLLAGTTRYPYRTFLVANVLGAVAWVAGVAAAGFWAARSLHTVDDVTGWLLWGSVLAVGLTLAVGLRTWVAGTPRAAIVRVGTSAVLAVTVLGLFGWLLLRQVDPEDVRRTMVGLRPVALVAVVVVECLAFASLAQVYRTTHRLAGGVGLRWREAMTASLGAFTLTQLLPGGGSAGAVFVARRLRRAGADTGTAAATVVLTGLVMMGTLGVVVSLTAGVVALLTGRHAVIAASSLSTTVLVLVLLAVVRYLVVHEAPRERLAGLVARVTRRGDEVAGTWSASLAARADVLADPRSLLAPSAWSACKWLLDAVVLATIADALGADAPVAGVLVALGVANLVAGIPLTPGGIGLVEAGMAGVFVAFGVDPIVASLTAVAHRVVGQWLPVAVALPIVARGVLRRAWLEAAA